MSHQQIAEQKQTHEQSTRSDPDPIGRCEGSEHRAIRSPADDVVDQFIRHRRQYRRIQDNLWETYDYFDRVGRDRRAELLNQAVTFALISAQCGVAQHEAGYVNVLSVGSDQTVGEALRDAGVNYWRNKARYIEHNHSEKPDVDRVLDHYANGRIDRMHRAIADEYLGVGLRKAAFAMALCVTDQKMCIDTHVAESAGLDADSVYNGVVVDRYERQCEHVLAQYPRLCDMTGSRFLSQWVCFDAQRGAITQHDPWFLSLPQAVDITW